MSLRRRRLELGQSSKALYFTANGDVTKSGREARYKARLELQRGKHFAWIATGLRDLIDYKRIHQLPANVLDNINAGLPPDTRLGNDWPVAIKPNKVGVIRSRRHLSSPLPVKDNPDLIVVNPRKRHRLGLDRLRHRSELGGQKRPARERFIPGQDRGLFSDKYVHISGPYDSRLDAIVAANRFVHEGPKGISVGPAYADIDGNWYVKITSNKPIQPTNIGRRKLSCDSEESPKRLRGSCSKRKFLGTSKKKVGSKGEKLFKQFHDGSAPKKNKVRLSDMKQLVHLGDITEIRYKPTDGSNIKGAVYRHKFKSRPKVLSTPDGKNIVIAGGNLKVKSNGVHG